MERETLVEALRPIRFPAEFAQLHLADALAAFAMGVALTLLIILMLRPMMARRASPVDVARRDMAALAERAPDERLLGLARMVQRLEVDGQIERPGWLDAALYRADTPVDFAALEASILAAVRTRRAAS